jgi:hypothetical protein
MMGANERCIPGETPCAPTRSIDSGVPAARGAARGADAAMHAATPAPPQRRVQKMIVPHVERWLGGAPAVL